MKPDILKDLSKLTKYSTRTGTVRYGEEDYRLKVEDLLTKQRDDTYQKTLRQVIEFINSLDNGLRSSGSWRTETRKFRQKLQEELEG